ncbi:MAG: flagellar M-ring protein FliF [Chloroflexota bacterium]|nr:MAG: flagellar M-ring protein FliF [Chloroflexota bacterium]
MDRLGALFSSLLALWSGLGRTQRFAIVGSSIAAIAALGILGFIAQQPDLVPVFRNVPAAEAAQIVQRLGASKTVYALSDSGTTILVPAAKANDIRLEMAGAGLLQGGTIGYELFNQSGIAALGMTEFSQRLNLQRALEGELSRTIMRFDNIENAQVRIVLPQQTLLTDRQKDATAAVIVKMKQRGLEPIKEMSPEQVRAIRQLLSRSVEGLKIDNVTIVDNNGVDLTDKIRTSDLETQNPRMTERQRDFQRDIEMNLARQIQAMLEQAIGPNRAVVRVNANLNWDQVTQDSEFFVPPSTVPDARPNVVRSEQSVTEKFAGPPVALPGGAPGVPSNVGPGAQAAQSMTIPGAPVAYERTDTIKNHEISKTVEKLTKAPGAIERMTVAVMLDGPMEEIQVQAIERTVAAAAGIKPERGDVVTVASMPFDRSLQEQQRRQMQESAQLEFYFNMAKVGAAVLISLFVLLFLRSMLARPSVTSTVLGPQLLPGTMPGVPGAGGDEALGAGEYYDEEFEEEEEEESIEDELPAPEMLEELEAPIEIPEIASPEEERIREMEERLREAQERRQALEEQVFNLARNNPEALADLIKTWLEEEEEARV